MSIALGLLVSAMQLLAIVATTPNISEDFRNQATTVANYAIQVAQTEIAAQSQPANTVVLQPINNPQTTNPQQTQPTFGAIIQPMDKSDLVIENVGKVGQADPTNGIPFGTWFIKATVLDAEGKHTQNAEISMTTNGVIDTRKSDTISTLHGEDYHRVFSYTPTKGGAQTLTFKFGDKTKQITLDVK